MKKQASKYVSQTPTEKDFDLFTPANAKIKSTPKEQDNKLFSANLEEVNKRMKAEKKKEEQQEKAWGDPANVFRPGNLGKTVKPSAKTSVIPGNIKELILLIKDLSSGIGTKDESLKKNLLKRSEKVLKPYGLT